MMRTQNSAFNTGNRLTERSRFVFTRRATDNQHIDTVIMLRCKSTNRQRSHAVPKQNHREVRKMPVYLFVHRSYILKHCLCSAAIHISQIIRILHALSMSAMIMNNCYVPFFRQIFHKRNITFFMLTHSMNQLNHCSVLCLFFRHDA